VVPTEPGAIVVSHPNTYHPVLIINYDKLADDQLRHLRQG